MDSAYVDKLARGKNGVEFLLVRQDLFDRSVDAEGMKTKDWKTTTGRFQERLQKVKPRKIWVDQGTEVAGEFQKFSRLKE